MNRFNSIVIGATMVCMLIFYGYIDRRLVDTELNRSKNLIIAELVAERDSFRCLYFQIKHDAINASSYLHELDFRTPVNVPDSLYHCFMKYND